MPAAAVAIRAAVRNAWHESELGRQRSSPSARSFMEKHMRKLACGLILTFVVVGSGTGAQAGPWCAFYDYRHTIVASTTTRSATPRFMGTADGAGRTFSSHPALIADRGRPSTCPLLRACAARDCCGEFLIGEPTFTHCVDTREVRHRRARHASRPRISSAGVSSLGTSGLWRLEPTTAPPRTPRASD